MWEFLVLNLNVVVGVVCAVIGAACFGHTAGVRHIQQKAIVAHAGRWSINPKTGLTVFEFISDTTVREHDEKLQLQTERGVGSISSRSDVSVALTAAIDDPRDLGLIASGSSNSRGPGKQKANR